MARFALMRPDNPLVEFETAMLERRSATITQSMRRRRNLFFLAIVALSLGVIAYAMIVVSDIDRLRTIINTPQDNTQNLLAIFSMLVVFIHIRVIFHAMNLPARGISRRTVQRWDTVVLTPLSRRTYVWVKWWLAVKMASPWFALLALLRVALVMGLSMFTSVTPRYYVNGQFIVEVNDDPTLRMMLGAGIIVLFTAVNLVFSAAVGVVGALLKSNVSPVSEASGARVTMAGFGALLLALPGLFVLISPTVSMDARALAGTILPGAMFSVFDNGTVMSILTASPAGIDNLDIVLASVALVLAVYGLLTWLALRWAMWIAGRLGMVR